MIETTYSVMLRFWSPRRSPDEISTALQIDPERCWNQGASRNTPQGTPLAGRHKDSYWMATLIERAPYELSLSKAVEKQLNLLDDKRDFLRGFVEDGGRSELYIGWHSEPGGGGDVFEYPLLARIADLRLNFAFEVFSHQRSPEAR